MNAIHLPYFLAGVAFGAFVAILSTFFCKIIFFSLFDIEEKNKSPDKAIIIFGRDKIKKLEREIKSLNTSIDYYKKKCKILHDANISFSKSHDQYRERMEEKLSSIKNSPKYKEDLQQPIFQDIFKKGRNALIKKAHPDHGGSREKFEEVEKAFDVLKNIKPVDV